MATLPSLADCSAARGRLTYKPRRTLRDELTDRATSVKLGTYSSHSMVLRLASFLEAISAHLERIDGNDAAQQRLRRETAKVKMGAASLASSDTHLLCLIIAIYGEQRNPRARPRQLMFWGRKFKGVLTGGVLSKNIVQYVLEQIRGEMWGVRFFVVERFCVVHDAVFEMAVQASSQLEYRPLCSDSSTTACRTDGASLSEK